jgi:uncharacterized protein YbjT (DUF2867 family)
MEDSVILVTGATGNTGSKVVRLLAEAGAPARALVRSPEKAASIQRLGLETVETVLGDFDQPDTLDAAMAGCDHLFLLSPPSPHQAEQERNAIDAAKRAGVGHVVALSVLGSSPDASVPFRRWHGEIDRHLVESGLPHTLLMPSGFMQNFLASAQTVAEQGALYGMTGDSRTSYIDIRDVAAVAARVLTSPGHERKGYALTGPEALSGDEVAERLSAATGRQVRSVDVGPDAYRRVLAGAGLPGWLVDRLIELNIMMAAGHAAGVTDEVAGLTGRQPRTFAQFAAEHRAIFGGQQ